MTMAISMAVDEGAKAVVCASTGQHVGLGGRLRGAGRTGLRGAHPRRPHRAGQAGPGAGARRAGAAGAGQLRPAADHRARAAEPRADHRGQLGQPAPHRGAEDRRLRDRRRAGRRARRPLHPGRQRREHLGLLAGLPAVQGGRSVHQAAPHARLPGRRCGADRAGPPGGESRDDRHRHPDRQPGQLVLGHGGRQRVRRLHHRGHRRGDPRTPTPSWPSRSRSSARRRRRRRWPG
jgi:hypothetical protein